MGENGLGKIVVDIRLAPETLFAAIDSSRVPRALEIVVLFVAKSDSVELIVDAVRAGAEPLAFLGITVLGEGHVATEQIGIGADDSARVSEQFVRLVDVVCHQRLHFLHRVVGVIQLEQEFLLRHLQLQIHLFAHAVAGLTIGHKQLYPHPDNEEQRR